LEAVKKVENLPYS